MGQTKHAYCESLEYDEDEDYGNGNVLKWTIEYELEYEYNGDIDYDNLEEYTMTPEEALDFFGIPSDGPVEDHYNH